MVSFLKGLYLMVDQNKKGKKGSLKEAFKVGDRAKNGWIYAGISNDPRSPRFNGSLLVAPEDAHIVMNWHMANEIAIALRSNTGNNKIGLPTDIELDQIFNAFAESAEKDVGGFKKDGSVPSGNYWAESFDKYHLCAPSQQFSDGVKSTHDRDYHFSVRFVQ